MPKQYKANHPGPPTLYGERMTKCALFLSKEQAAWIKELGEGVPSRGVRIAIDIAMQVLGEEDDVRMSW